MRFAIMTAQSMGVIAMSRGYRRIWVSLTMPWLIFYVIFYVTNCHELPWLLNGPFSFDYATWEKIHRYYYLCEWDHHYLLVSLIEIILRGVSIPAATFVVLLVAGWIIRGFTTPSVKPEM
jgi:hypothetical protein